MAPTLTARFQAWRRNRAFFHQHRDALGLERRTFLVLRKQSYTDLQERTVSLFGRPFVVGSAYWFLHSLEEIFIQEVYRFEASGRSPLILDCGANWGLSVLYFKRFHPSARVVAFEPDRQIFEMLRRNVASFELRDVELLNQAVWTRDETLQFSSEGVLGGSLSQLGVNKNTEAPAPVDVSRLSGAAATTAAEVAANPSDAKDIITRAVIAHPTESDAIVQAGLAVARDQAWDGSYNHYLGVFRINRVAVQAVRLRDILARYPRIDFLKIDIEGAEYEVIKDCQTALGHVSMLFVEYHSLPDQPQRLGELLEFFRNAGFRYYIKEASNIFLRPFVRDKKSTYDIQLNIFCYR